MYRDISDKVSEGRLEYNRAKSAGAAGNYAEELQGYRRSLVLRQEVGDEMGILYSLEGLANVAMNDDDWYRGVVLLSGTAAARSRMTLPIPEEIAAKRQQGMERARVELSPDAYHDAQSVGSKMEVEALVLFAMGDDTKSESI